MTVGWSTAVPDWQARIVARQSLIPVLPIDAARGAKALRIFKRLRLVDVPGEPTMGDACADWVFDFVHAIFGAFDQAASRQLVREFFLCIAKKNGKSTIAAGVMVTALVMNQRRQGEYLILAPTKDVADNSFTPAFGMIEADAALRRRYKPSQTTREIENRLDGSILAVKAADADTVGGQKATSVLVDELWLFGKKASSENMLSEATGSLASRPEGFVIFLSTQSDEAPAGVFKTKLDYHRDVRDGIVADPTSLPLIFEYPPDMLKAEAWRDPATFYIPNPSLGRGVDREWLLTEYRKKEIEGAGPFRLFLSKHLNVEIGMSLRANRWPGAKHWSKGADKSITLRSILERCEVVVVGIDGGGLDDLFGLSVLGREAVEVEMPVLVDGAPVAGQIQTMKRWLLWSHAWCHRDVLEIRKSIASNLLDFERAGELTIVDDQLGDISAIVAIVEEVRDAGLLGGVAVDPAGLGDFVDAMAAIDVTQDNKLLVGIGQGYRMMNAIKTGERRLANGTLKHADQAIMEWCVGNLKIEPTATAIRATKQNAGDAKIDPAMAMFDAIDLMSTNPEAAGRSAYETRGLLILGGAIPPNVTAIVPRGASGPLKVSDGSYGVLKVPAELERHVRRALPPEHTIVAELRPEGRGVIEFVVRGPFLPPWADANAPPDTDLALTSEQTGDGRLRVMGQFLPGGAASSPTPTWEIGIWADAAEFEANWP